MKGKRAKTKPEGLGAIRLHEELVLDSDELAWVIKELFQRSRIMPGSDLLKFKNIELKQQNDVIARMCYCLNQDYMGKPRGLKL